VKKEYEEKQKRKKEKKDKEKEGKDKEDKDDKKSSSEKEDDDKKAEQEKNDKVDTNIPVRSSEWKFGFWSPQLQIKQLQKEAQPKADDDSPRIFALHKYGNFKKWSPFFIS